MALQLGRPYSEIQKHFTDLRLRHSGQVPVSWLYVHVQQESRPKLSTKRKQTEQPSQTVSQYRSTFWLSQVKNWEKNKNKIKNKISCLPPAMLNAPTHLLFCYRTLISNPFLNTDISKPFHRLSELTAPSVNVFWGRSGSALPAKRDFVQANSAKRFTWTRSGERSRVFCCTLASLRREELTVVGLRLMIAPGPKSSSCKRLFLTLEANPRSPRGGLRVPGSGGGPGKIGRAGVCLRVPSTLSGLAFCWISAANLGPRGPEQSF